MESISQSFFLSAPRKKNLKRAAYRDPFDSDDRINHSYDNLWNALQTKFENVREELSKNFITKISNYIKTFKYTRESIPALTLLNGVNVSDHDSLFQLIKKEMKSVTKYPTVMIRSCHDTSVKSVIERLVQSLLLSKESIESDEGSDSDSKDDEEILKKMKKSMCTLRRLELWYENRKTDENDNSPLIIIIPHVESFCCRVLSDFFYNLSVYKSKIPFMVILGIATDLNAIHQRVSQPVLQHFELIIFKAQSSLELLDIVLEKIFLTADCPFQLHGEVLEQFIEVFTFYNFSVEFFIRGIQFCIIDHFLKSKRNILCCPINQVSEVVKSLSTDEIKELFNLPSVRISNTLKRERKLNEINKNNLVLCIEHLHRRLSKFHVAMRCFHVIVKNVLDRDFDKKLRNIYCKAMQNNFIKSESFKYYILQFKLLSLEKTLESIKAMEELLLPLRDDSPIAEKLKEFVQFRHIFESLMNEDTSRLNSSSPRKRKTSPIKMNIITQKSPKKEQLNPQENLEDVDERDDSEASIKMKNLSEDEILTTPKIAHNSLDDSTNGSPRKMLFGKGETVTPKSVLSPLNSSSNIRSSPHKLLSTPTTPSTDLSQLNSPSCVRSSPRKLPSSPVKPNNACKKLYSPNAQSLQPSSNRSEFQKTLRENAYAQKRPLSALEKHKENLAKFLSDGFFGEFLECPTQYPFNEIMLYNDVSHVKKHYTSVNQRKEIENALHDPQSFLKCKCCKLKTSDDFPETMPDLCIAYRLFLEHIKEDISSESLLTSFNSKVMPSEQDSITSDVYNRFRQTMRELQLMGFIEPNKRKPGYFKNLNLMKHVKQSS